MLTHDTATEEMVRVILENPEAHEWSIQGFGMLRTYLDSDHVRRLHIWDPDRANDEVSTIHDHPWHFVSEVVSGFIGNVVYLPDPAGHLYRSARIRCGEGGGLVEEPTETRLYMKPTVGYPAGMGYSMLAEELHESYPNPGTVSIITRTFQPDNTDIAHVYWRRGEWVSAEPRPATEDEADHFTRLALNKWSPREEW